MSALRALAKSATEAAKNPIRDSPRILYRAMIRELPRVLAIYDIDMPVQDAIAGIRYQFKKRGPIEDSRISYILLQKGYMDFEETLMQWKNKVHLLNLIQPRELQEAPPTLEEIQSAQYMEEHNIRRI